MKKNVISFFAILFLISSISVAQSKKEVAYSNIQILHDGALFVRLKTSQNQINALIKMGDAKKAEEIRLQQENENKQIAAAFKANFTFCKVYFFYSNYSTEVKNGNYKPYLMNSDLQIDSSFTGNYLVGEFDESETTKLDAFIMKDKNYVQLKPPFPFLIKNNQMLVTARSKDEVVKLLNSKLTDFAADK